VAAAAAGLDPISLADVEPFSGKDLPKLHRETWLQTVAGEGGENGPGGRWRDLGRPDDRTGRGCLRARGFN
jgi:sugar O-acyltransferase (sialic acid O-acetyltransferase NeuD family)